MNYQVYPASPEMQTFIKCFWTLEDEASPESMRQRVVPDGCMEMIFHYGDPYRQYFEDGTSVIQPRSFVFGQITKFIEIGPTGRSGIVSGRFLPEGLIPFLEHSVNELENKATILEVLFGEKGKLLEERVVEAKTNEKRINLISEFLLTLLKVPTTIDSITKSCIETIVRSHGQLDVESLAGKLNVNRRNLERRFSSTIGMSPKQLSRVVRLQATIRMLEQKKFTSLTSLAYENGYFDQAHFIKDFKEFTGISPKSFYADNFKFALLFASSADK